MTAPAVNMSEMRFSSIVPDASVISTSVVDLRPMFPAVYDGGTLSTDMSGALCSAFQYMDPGGFAGSRLFLDYAAQTLMTAHETSDQMNYPTDSLLYFGIQALETIGIPAEVDWPYNATSAASKPPNSCYSSAFGHKLLQVINLDESDPAHVQLKACLQQQIPWIVALNIYSGWYNDPAISGTTASDGTVTKGTGVISQSYQTAQSETHLGNITVCIVGYDDSQQYFIARTSLGPSMGDSGYYYFPYNFMSPANIMSKVWSLRVVSNSAPVDCVLKGGWSTGTCDPPIGAGACGWTGTSLDTREILTYGSNGGIPCPSPTQTTPCLGPVCPVPCVMGDWQNGTCSPGTPAPKLSCGWTGTRTDTRTVTTQAAGGAPACPTNLTRTSTCAAPVCPVDCVMGKWSAYGACDATVCGTSGSQTRTRAIVTPAQGAGAACPASLSQTTSCNAPACAVDCLVGDWSEWSACSSTLCGTAGVQTVTRAVTQAAAGAGQQCPALSSTMPCDPACSSEITVTVVVFSAVMFLLLAAAGAMALM